MNGGAAVRPERPQTAATPVLEPGLRANGFWLVAVWGLANALMALVLRGYAGTAIELGLFGFAVLLVEGFALAVLVSRNRRPSMAPVFVIGRSSMPACFAAIGLALAGFGVALWPWPLYVAAVPLTAAAMLALKDRKERPADLRPASLALVADLSPGEVPATLPLARSRSPRLLELPAQSRPPARLVEALRPVQKSKVTRPLAALAAIVALGAVAAAAVAAHRLAGRDTTTRDVDLDEVIAAVQRAKEIPDSGGAGPRPAR